MDGSELNIPLPPSPAADARVENAEKQDDDDGWMDLDDSSGSDSSNSGDDNSIKTPGMSLTILNILYDRF